MKRLTSVACIQDMVHLAVKLKSRLLRPSIMLPLGNYTAGGHHLRLLHNIFSKDQHGPREKDINHKDKQNYDAVLRMTSDSVMELLTYVPDAKGTMVYLRIMKLITDSFLNKNLECLVRIENAWYSVFMLRYWRQWIVLNPGYNLSDHFITSNAYTCVELNAHSLLTLVISMQTILPADSKNFLPWLLGSQCCEKVFRAARSMSSVFSTIINFNMLGLLQRFHRLHIQTVLESESDETTIKYPHVEGHKKKDGHSCTNIHGIHSVSLDDIVKSVEQACKKAKETVTELGMSELLKKHQNWDKPPVCFLQSDEGFEDEEEDEEEDEVTEESIQEDIADPEEVLSGISQLSNAKLIDDEMANHLTALHRASFKKVENSALPIYELQFQKRA